MIIIKFIHKSKKILDIGYLFFSIQYQATSIQYRPKICGVTSHFSNFILYLFGSACPFGGLSRLVLVECYF